MSKYPYGKQKILDGLQKDLDRIERAWPMTGSYERVDPYIIPLMQGNQWFELIVYHIESKLWFDKSYFDTIVHEIVTRELIKPGSVAFDLGSNSGSLTLPMAVMAGDDGHVHAFDPYPWNAAATQASCRLNHLHNVTAHAVGLSNRTHDISVSPNDSRTYAESTDGNAQRLAIRHVREYMHLKPSFLKIDVEGAEHDLFDIDDPHLYDCVETAALEFHPMWLEPRGVDCKASLRNVENCGFSIHAYRLDAPPYDIESFRSNQYFFWLKHLPLGAKA
jgi:FkbM family methyltransferase